MSTTPRVDFYLLEAADPASKLSFACRLTEKAYGLGNKVYAHASNEADARRFDELLWTFRQGSFIPHERFGGEEPRAPVSIGTVENCQASGDVLINLADNAPDFAGNYARIAEIVDGSEASKASGRARFRQYRDMGIEPETHTIK